MSWDEIKQELKGILDLLKKYKSGRGNIRQEGKEIETAIQKLKSLLEKIENEGCVN